VADKDLRTHDIQSDEDNSDDDNDIFQTGKPSNNILVVDLKQIYTNYLNNKKQAHQARLSITSRSSGNQSMGKFTQNYKH
jgi:hypothetical protein